MENTDETKAVKNLTEVVFILDRSGSMGGLEADTIGGYNSMLDKQKSEDGDVIISTVLFDDRTEVIHDRKKLQDVAPLTDKEYYVRGCTALLDAIGGAIKHINRVQKEQTEEERPDKTIFIITTDGLENSSQLYTYDKVKKMVEKKKTKKGWEFIFMGANIDAIEVANRFGVDKSRAVRFESDNVGHELNYSVMSKIIGCARAAASPKAMNIMLDRDEALAEIREDYEDLMEISKDRSAAPDFSSATDAQIKKLIKDHKLTDREQKLITMIWGLDDGRKKTYEEVGAAMGITPERAHQCVSHVLRKLKSPTPSRKLKDYLI